MEKYHAAQFDELIRAALQVRLQAYAPYSRYQVGAAILTERLKIYSGCNVEAADYDGTHAEESALAAMVAAGERAQVVPIGIRSKHPGNKLGAQERR